MSLQRRPGGPEGETIRVLHVDDDRGIVDLAATHLESESETMQVHTATDTASGLELLKSEPIDCIVSDYDMPQMDGLELLEAVREGHPELPFILYTGKGSEEIASEAISRGVTDYLQKQKGTEQYELLANRIENAVEHHRTRSTLEGREEWFRKLIEGATDLVAVLDEEGHFTYLSPSVEAVLGHEPEELLGADGDEYVHPEDESDAADMFAAVVEQPDRTETVQFRFRDGNGEWRHIEARARNMLDVPAIEGVVVNARDVTERVERERERREQREFTQRVLDTIDDIVYVFDEDLNFTWWNDRATEVSGYTDEELEAEGPTAFFKGEDIERIAASVEEVFETGSTTVRADLVMKDGREVPYEFRGGRLTDENGDPSGFCGIGRDITDQLERERELERRSTAIDASVDGIAILDAEERYDYINDAHAEIYGYDDPADLEGETWHCLYDEDERERFQEEVMPVVESEGEWRGEATGLHRDGTTFPQEVSLTALDDGGLVCIVRDVTERVERERELRAERAFTESILDGLPDVVYVLDRDVEFLRWNDRANEVTGYTDDEIAEMNPLEFVPEEDHGGLVANFEEIIEEGVRLRTETHLITKEGERIPHELHGSRITDDDGEVLGTVGVARDISDRLEREQELERYERIIETVPDGVYVTDADGRYVEVNDYVLDTMGYDREELVGGRATMLVGDNAMDELNERVAELLDDDGPDIMSIELPIETADGGTLLAEARLTLRPRGEDGEFRGTVGVVRDVTGRIVREWQLERQNERLEEFASVVSHDLRNPLNVARGHLELAREEQGDIDDHLQTVHDTHERMESLITDLLALARSGRVVEDTDPTTLSKSARDAWKAVETDEADLEVGSSMVFNADADRLSQLFENLYRNARDHGRKDVTVRVGSTGDGFYVADDGPGIPEDEREWVLEHGHTTDDDGTGLGLSIVQNIVEAHGWSIDVTESADGGARFEVTGIETA